MPYQATRIARAEAPRPTAVVVGGTPADDDGPTYDELYEEARQRGLKGRSKMSKTELERALGR